MGNPTYDVFVISEKEGAERQVWTKVGTAFTNPDGSLALHLEALPLDGKLHCRLRKADDKACWANEPQPQEHEVPSAKELANDAHLASWAKKGGRS